MPLKPSLHRWRTGFRPFLPSRPLILPLRLWYCPSGIGLTQGSLSAKLRSLAHVASEGVAFLKRSDAQNKQVWVWGGGAIGLFSGLPGRVGWLAGKAANRASVG